jgi:MFS family permease
MWGAYFLNYCDRQAVFAMFKSLKLDLAMSDRELGLTGAVFLWVYGLGCPLAGYLADRYPKRILVITSLVIWSAVTLATGFATSAAMLLVLRAAMGISESLYMPAAIALTADATPADKRSRAVSILTTAQIAGSVAGAWFGGWMAGRGQWRGAFFSLGIVGIVYALPYFRFLRTLGESGEKQAKDESVKRIRFSELASVPTYRVLCFAFPVFVFGLWMLYSWIPTYLQEKFALSSADAGFHASAYLQTGTLAGLFLGGYLADRLTRVTSAARLWLLVASLALCAPCLHGIGAGGSLFATSVALAAFGLFGGFLVGNIFPAAFDVVPSGARASAVGILNFFGSMLSGFAPLAVGEWKKTIGIERMLSGTGIAYFVAAVVLSWAILRRFPADRARAQNQ